MQNISQHLQKKMAWTQKWRFWLLEDVKPEHPEVIEPKMWAGYCSIWQNPGPWCWSVPGAGPLPQHPGQNQGERTLPTLSTTEEREEKAKGLLTLSLKGSLTLELFVLFQKFVRAV